LFPGQALGGATFLGLARALTSATTFDEALALAAEGEAANVDTLVEDIYGSTGCVDLGLPPSLTAASFGKLSRADLRSTSDADVCRALLEMVAQSCCVLARAHAAQLGCRQRVFFAGGFVDENPLARATIANSLKSLGGKAHFLRHSDFLGALGATAHALDHAHAHKVSQLPGNPADPAKDDDPRSPTSLRPPRKSANLARGASAA
jgi:type II pantothenate kinase